MGKTNLLTVAGAAAFFAAPAAAQTYFVGPESESQRTVHAAGRVDPANLRSEPRRECVTARDTGRQICRTRTDRRMVADRLDR